MRLLTFQLASRAAQLRSGERYRVSWEYVAPAWAGAYQWLAGQWQQRCGSAMVTAPIWCWQRLASDSNAIDCASLLFSQYEKEQGILMLELEVPSALVLLSSYRFWNEFLVDAIDSGAVSTEDGRWRRMFSRKALKKRTDSVQAIIPYIEPEWIMSMRPVVFFDDIPSQEQHVMHAGSGVKQQIFHHE